MSDCSIDFWREVRACREGPCACVSTGGCRVLHPENYEKVHIAAIDLVNNPSHHASGAVEGRKDDAGKLPLGLIPREALLAEAAVLEFGAKKYDAHDWRKGMVWSRLGDAAMRHLLAWLDGEDNDPETGLPHLAHLRCCAGFLLNYAERGIGKDDRHTAADADA